MSILFVCPFAHVVNPMVCPERSGSGVGCRQRGDELGETGLALVPAVPSTERRFRPIA